MYSYLLVAILPCTSASWLQWALLSHTPPVFWIQGLMDLPSRVHLTKWTVTHESVYPGKFYWFSGGHSTLVLFCSVTEILFLSRLLVVPLHVCGRMERIALHTPRKRMLQRQWNCKYIYQIIIWRQQFWTWEEFKLHRKLLKLGTPLLGIKNTTPPWEINTSATLVVSNHSPELHLGTRCLSTLLPSNLASPGFSSSLLL